MALTVSSVRRGSLERDLLGQGAHRFQPISTWFDFAESA